MNSDLQKEKVQVVVVARDHVLLLQFKKFHNEGFQNITGSVEAGENFLTAAHRELKEETALLTDKMIDLQMDFNYCDRWGYQVTEKVFLCFLNQSKPPIKISEEHQNFKWIYLPDISSNHYVFPSNYEACKKAAHIIKEQQLYA